MKVLLLADHDGRELAEAMRNTLTAAQTWNAEIEVLVCGHEVQPVAEQAALLAGVSSVLLADAPYLAQALIEDFSALLATVSSQYKVIIAPHNRFFASGLAHLAGRCDTGLIQDVIEIYNGNTYVRQRCAGVATETVHSSEAQQILTVRFTRFAPCSFGTAASPIRVLSLPDGRSSTRRTQSASPQGLRSRLREARVIVSGGRSLGERFLPTLQPLAAALGAQMGATRGAVDNKLVPRDWQIGQTGSSVEPQLYVAVGASGATQHQVGIRNSSFILAINKDPKAPIFGIADFGLVGDMFEIVPKLIDALEETQRKTLSKKVESPEAIQESMHC